MLFNYLSSGYPDTVEEQQRLATEFKFSINPTNPIVGCIGALNSIALKIARPPAYANPAQFWCQKGFYSLPVQAVCDARYRFTYMYTFYASSIHNSFAFAVSSLSRRLKADDFPFP